MTDRPERPDPRPASEAAPTALTGDVGQLVRMAGSRPVMSDDSVARMQGELRPLWETEVERGRGRRTAPRLWAAAALIVIAVAAVLLSRAALERDAVRVASVVRTSGSVTAWTEGGSASGTSLSSGAVVALGRSLATGEESRAALETTTGHSLRLDHDTRIAFLSEHEVRLEQGAVYIDSGAPEQAARSLSVVTAIGRVEEIGTQFEVRLAADTMTVRVREGAVEVGADGNRHRGGAGEQLVVARGKVQRSAIEPSDALFDWTQAIAPDWSLDDRRLDTFLSWVARESGLALEYSDDSIASAAPGIRLRGDIDGVTPRQALDVVLPAVDLRYRIDDGTLWIDRR